MKKFVTSTLVVLSMIASPALRADDSGESVEETVGTPVGQASNEGVNAARNKQWQNIGIAVAAVAVAVTAMLLVASNDGHHHSKGKSGNNSK